VYGLNYLDKTCISYASVMGLRKPPAEGGIGVTSDQYSWLGSM
jgi:ACS family allantoate permease-like MFS transporter